MKKGLKYLLSGEGFFICATSGIGVGILSTLAWWILTGNLSVNLFSGMTTLAAIITAAIIVKDNWK